ncbi:MAG: 3-deoxy-7-phosphoheptulonate synthase [Nanoarchaeota archaeon]|nr:3-deoxy-7-phosphoheptulonate synthase [Nanoarchaeota archaeon]
MIIQMREGATSDQVTAVVNQIKDMGYSANISGADTKIIGLIGNPHKVDPDLFERLDGVGHVEQITDRYKLVNRKVHPEPRLVPLNGTMIGEGQPRIVIAGPCAVEDLETMLEAGRIVKEAGAHGFRAGAYKPRTAGIDFQGYGLLGLQRLDRVKETTGLPIVTEATGAHHHVVTGPDGKIPTEINPEDIAPKFIKGDKRPYFMGPGRYGKEECFEKVHSIFHVTDHADILQIGTRNGQAYGLLQTVAELTRNLKHPEKSKPVLLKRGMSSSLKEFVNCAEYLAAYGNPNVILCLRGIQPAKDGLRNNPDYDQIPLLRKMTNLPIVFDPSHAYGVRDMVVYGAEAALGHGADGLLIEAHPDPQKALTDGHQTVNPDVLEKIVRVAENYI